MDTVDSRLVSPDREIILERLFDSPRELVWQAFTDAARLARWWGPNGFTTRTHRMDVRPGGEWRFVMVGPDGREYQNLITYLEVEPPGRLRYKHGGSKDVEPVNFEVTVSLEPAGGDARQTRVTMRSVFPTKQARDFVVREYGAIDGGRQTLARLAEQLAATDTGDAAFVIARVLRAPPELVWDAWTRAEHLVAWMGPKGTKIVRSSLDLRPGGIFHYGMQSPDGTVRWGKWTFREVVPRERLVTVVSFSDEHGGITRHPLADRWPLETLSTLTFAPHAGIGGGTTIVLEWRAINATADERALFAASHASMHQGWGGTFEQLEAHLARAEA